MTNASMISGLAATAGRRGVPTAPTSGEGFTAEVAQAQTPPTAKPAPAGSGGLIAPSSLAALVQAQTPQSDGLSLTGLRLPTPELGRNPGGQGGFRDHLLDETAG